MERKVFKSIDEVVQYLENQMIVAKVNELHRQQLDFIDEAVLQSDLKESKAVIERIMSL